jgi:hypothetical protein
MRPHEGPFLRSPGAAYCFSVRAGAKNMVVKRKKRVGRARWWKARIEYYPANYVQLQFGKRVDGPVFLDSSSNWPVGPTRNGPMVTIS